MALSSSSSWLKLNGSTYSNSVFPRDLKGSCSKKLSLVSSACFSGFVTIPFNLTASWVYSLRQLLVPSTAGNSFGRQSFVNVKPVCAELKRSDSVVSLAATLVAPGIFVVQQIASRNLSLY